MTHGLTEDLDDKLHINALEQQEYDSRIAAVEARITELGKELIPTPEQRREVTRLVEQRSGLIREKIRVEREHIKMTATKRHLQTRDREKERARREQERQRDRGGIDDDVDEI